MHKITLFILCATLSHVLSQDCVDSSSYCFLYKFICRYSWYKEWLTKNCAGTCPNLCSRYKCGTQEVQPYQNIGTSNRGAWPWQVLVFLNGKPLCGGSLVAPRWIVTAAHCVDGLERFSYAYEVRVGEHNLRKYEGSEVDLQVEKIFTHPSYSSKTNNNDIALIKLKRDVAFGKYVRSICLPASNDKISIGAQCYLTGWGNLKNSASGNSYLLQRKFLVAKNSACTTSNRTHKGVHVTDQMICASHNGVKSFSACHGDSGGPFVCQTGANGAWVLAGTVSWGSGTCESSNSYTVLTRVSEFRGWIDQMMAAK